MSLPTLKKPWQFRHVYRNGKKIDGNCAVLFYYRTGEAACGPCFGFVASKRVGNAVRRNRAKRLLRHASVRAARGIRAADLWLVLVARSGILKTTYEDLVTELEAQLERAGLLDRN